MPQPDAYKVYRNAIALLQSADPQALDDWAAADASFPHHCDDFIGRRWIINAIDGGAIAAIRWMLDRGVELNFRDEEGYTPLHAALERAYPDRYEVLELLLLHGAPVNLKGVNDYTPAHLAAARDDVQALILLVCHGADLTIRTDIDCYATPLEEAIILKKQNAIAYLQNVR